MGKSVVKSTGPFGWVAKKFTQTVDRIESKPISAASWILAFFSIVFIRNLVEVVSSWNPFLSKSQALFFFYHLPGFYFFSFLGLILILFLCTREKIEKISKIVLFILPILLLSITIDMIVGNVFEKAMRTNYLEFPPFFENGWAYFKFFLDFTFFGPYGLFFWGDLNITQAQWNYGIRIEINVITLAAAAYIFSKTGNFFKTLWGALLVIIGLFPLSFFPYLITQAMGIKNATSSIHNFSNLVPSFGYNETIFGFYFLYTAIFALTIFFFLSREKFISLFQNFRLGRTLNHVILLCFGIALGIATLKWNHAIGFFDIMVFALASCSVMFEWFSAVCYNDIQDEKGDAVAMPDRPLVRRILSRSEMSFFSVFFLALSLYVSAIVGYGLFMMMLLKACLGYLYSSPFFRLKKIPLVSNFVLALAYLLTAMAGYLVVHPLGFHFFPLEAVMVILVSYTLVSPFKDIKDYKGDKIDGIKTIPVIFGLERWKKIIGVLGAIGFLFVPAILNEYLIRIALPSLVAAVIYFFLVTAKKYVESRIFYLYFGYAAVISILLNL